ncbi:MAG: N-acetyl-gamma-glutamyl-phosphate reductase [Actinomycetales bacterium]|nr:N-acetyl-gamma-glutamyl-phosphate reductase [Actinomycetales bacterium]
MKIGVVGASGYAGGELLRLLAGHPEFEAAVITAGSNAGEEITSVHPQLSQYAGRKFSQTDAANLVGLDLIFTALPHGESAKLINQLDPNQKVVDLGADFRLKSSEQWKKYYGGEHAGTWVYGLPELPNHREIIKASNRVANPGCYATVIALATAPMLPFVNKEDVVVVAASGTTGAGRAAKVNLIGSEVMGSLTSYKFGGTHQHTPEIEQATGARISFTPILAPMPRGILATVTASLTNKGDVNAAFIDAYKAEEFVWVLPDGQMPKTSAVVGSNYVQMQVAIDDHANRVVVSAVIDNLGKGAAGQAIQNANLICGLHEFAGLTGTGIGA